MIISMPMPFRTKTNTYVRKFIHRYDKRRDCLSSHDQNLPLHKWAHRHQRYDLHFDSIHMMKRWKYIFVSSNPWIGSRWVGHKEESSKLIQHYCSKITTDIVLSLCHMQQRGSVQWQFCCSNAVTTVRTIPTSLVFTNFVSRIRNQLPKRTLLN